MVLESVLGVLVLYKRSLRESETFMSLSKALVGTSRRLDLLVYDNSPESHFDKNVELGYSVNITYIHDSTNPGICKAYNTGFEKALAINKKWLLLLDQDTDITFNYIESLLNAVEKDKNYASIVPVIYSNSNIVSPTRHDFLGRMKAIEEVEVNRVVSNITAINSGTCISTKFLKEINGFNTAFPLDMLDHWFNYMINTHNRNTFVINTKLMHKLSVADYNSISIDRYEKIIKSERDFALIKDNKLLFSFKLMLRIAKLLINGNFLFAYKSIKFI